MRAKAPLRGLGGLNAVGCLLTAKDIRQQSLDVRSKALLSAKVCTQQSLYIRSKTIITPPPLVHSWIYARQTIAKAFAKNIFINQERRLGDRKRSDTVVVLTVNYAN